MLNEWEIIKSIDPFGKTSFLIKEKPDTGAGCIGYLILISSNYFLRERQEVVNLREFIIIHG